MTLCSGGRYNAHEEICYEGNGNCPLCTANDEIVSLQKQIEKLEREVE